MPFNPDALRTLATADGARLAYCASIPDEPHGAVLLLHGVASNHTRWSEFSGESALRVRWALLRPDLRGHGASTFRGRIDVDRWCADLAALLDAEGLRRAVLVGHCFGANLALAFAARFPERTIGLVLIEPMPPEALRGTMGRLRRLRPLLRGLIGVVRSCNALGVHRRAIPSLDLAALDRETRIALKRGEAEAAALEQYGSPLSDLRTTPTAAYLQALLAVTEPLPPPERIAVPVLALLAQHAGFTAREITLDVLRRLPDCEIAILPAVHWIPTEQPDAMREAIDSWVARRFAGGAAPS